MGDSVLLFYRYVPIENVKAEAAAQEELCQTLNVVGGRIRIANEGLNGTLAAPQETVSAYISHMESDPRFKGTDWKVSSCGEQSAAEVFPDGVRVQQVNEVVSSGGALARVPLSKGGVHLSPRDFHEAVKEMLESEQGRSRRTLLLDVRNHYEQLVGRFAGATNPMTRSFGEFVSWVDDHRGELQEADRVLMYCTGGVRCEKASAYVNTVIGADGSDARVLQLKGGIHRYLEEYGADGLFCGSNFVFDNRVAVLPHSTDSQEVENPAKANSKAMGNVPTPLEVKLEETKNAVGSCEECQGKKNSVSSSDRNETPISLRDEVRCRSCRMLVMACDFCVERFGKDLFCSKCMAEGLGVRGRAEIQNEIERVKRKFEEPGLRGRRKKSRRLALRRKLALLEERFQEIE